MVLSSQLVLLDEIFKIFFSKFINFEDIAIATTEADKAMETRPLPCLIFSKSRVFPTRKEPTGVILVNFDHFVSSDFNVWLRSWRSSFSMVGDVFAPDEDNTEHLCTQCQMD